MRHCNLWNKNRDRVIWCGVRILSSDYFSPHFHFFWASVVKTTTHFPHASSLLAPPNTLGWPTLSFLHWHSLLLALTPSAYMLSTIVHSLLLALFFDFLLCFKPSDITHPILIFNDVSPNRCQCGPFTVVRGPDSTPFVGFKFTHCEERSKRIKSHFGRKGLRSVQCKLPIREPALNQILLMHRRKRAKLNE